MTDYFLRSDMRRGTLHAFTGADSLLRWASDSADGALPEQVYRDREGRKTVRLELDGRHFFLKLHRGVGWAEIGKNLLQGRLPVVGAANEYRAIRALESAGVATLSVAAFASRGLNPARRRSLVLTDELAGTVSLETFCASWSEQAPAFSLRQRLVVALACLARRMHACRDLPTASAPAGPLTWGSTGSPSSRGIPSMGSDNSMGGPSTPLTSPG